MYSSSSEKNKYCDICGRLIKDEPIIPMAENIATIADRTTEIMIKPEEK